MMRIRKGPERGYADHGWLKSSHTFSFASYRDPNHMGFRTLRVINEDRVAAGCGFGTHAHSDMEIVTYVLDGELEHKDSLGNGQVLRPGQFQRITAGSGITHSEFNPSLTSETHFYQIWILPDQRGLEPSYEQKDFSEQNRRNRLQLVASKDGANDSLLIHQDAKIYLLDLHSDQHVQHSIPEGRHLWIQALRGTAKINDQLLQSGDAGAISNEQSVTLRAADRAELMIFDLP